MRRWWQILLFPALLVLNYVVIQQLAPGQPQRVLWLSRKAAGQMGGGIFGMGKSQARRYDQSTVGDRGITFADVAGIEEAKAELVEVVDFLKDPAKYTRLGGVVPKGVLLIGAVGTGKTLLARAW